MLRADTTDRTLVAAGQQVCGDHGACAWPATQQINALTAASWCAGGARRSRDQRTFNFDHTAHRTGATWADSRRILGDDAAWAARKRAQVSAWGPATSAVVLHNITLGPTAPRHPRVTPHHPPPPPPNPPILPISAFTSCVYESCVATAELPSERLSREPR